MLLTAGPVEGGETSWSVRFDWTGTDPDGYVARYEYAVDPPDPDAIPWVATLDFSRRFNFAVPDPDSATVDGERRPAPRYVGAHAFYLRAVDDRGAASEVSRVGFTATTLTREAWITSPQATADILLLGETLHISWDGIDPDAWPAPGLPARFEYKLVNLRALDPPLSVLTAADPAYVLNVAAAAQPWTAAAPEERDLTLSLLVPGSYVFGVRAVDETGAAGPFFSYRPPGGTSGNAIRIQTASGGGTPTLTVTEALLGTMFAHGRSDLQAEFLTGVPLEFRWRGDASGYGGQIDGFNLAVDPGTLDDDDTAWRGWTTATAPEAPIVFTNAGSHRVVIRTRDRDNVVSTLVLDLDLTTATFAHRMLLVDDVRDGTYPTDAERDAFWRRMLEGSGRIAPGEIGTDVGLHKVYGAADLEYFYGEAPTLAQLAAYRLVLFDSARFDAYHETALSTCTEVTRRLGVYARAGGSLWITGESTVPSMLPAIGHPDLAASPIVVPGTFLWDILKMRSADIRSNATLNPAIDGLYAVDPFPGRNEIFPRMSLDPTRMTPGADSNGLVGVDALFAPLDPGLDAGPSGVIDSLYAFRGRPPELTRNETPFDWKLVAYRWHDPDPDRDQGRVMWFGFPVYWFHEAEFQETFNRAIDWFREESPAGDAQ